MNNQSGTAVFRRWVIALLTLIALFIGARVVVSIYQLAHPRDVDVWCGPIQNGNWSSSFHGPADLVLGACGVKS